MKERNVSCFLLLLLSVVLLLFGCSADNQGRSTMQIRLQKQESTDRTIVPDDTPLAVSRYVIEGTGPQEETFSVVSTDTKTEVTGLLIGQWSVIAVGQNSQGMDLVRGSTTITLGSEGSEAVIELNQLSGTGELHIEFFWDHTRLNDASLQLWLIDSQNAKRTLTPKINNTANGSVTYQESLAAGSYTLQAQLKSGNSVVAGCVEVVRIVGARTTETAIELQLDKYSAVPHSFSLIDHLGVPVTCTIGGISESMPAQKPATATLHTESGQNLNVVWYLDGEEIGEGTSCSFIPESGTHRLDLIATGDRLASSGSASIAFNASIVGASGIPTLVKTVADSNNGIHIGAGAKVAFLPDGKFLLASEVHKTLQVCRIVRDSVEVVRTYTAADGFYLDGIRAIYVDSGTYRIAISTEVNPKLTLYLYDLGDSSLSKICEKGNNYGIGGDQGGGTFPYLHSFAFDPATGVLMGLHPTEEVVVATNFYANTNSSMDHPYYFSPTFGDREPFGGMAFSPSGEYAALTKPRTNTLQLFSKSEFSSPYFAPITSFTSPGTPYLTDIEEVCFLDEDTLIYGTVQDVGRFARIGGTTWQQEEIYTSQVSGTSEINRVRQLAKAKDGALLYALCSGSRNLHAFSHSLSSSFVPLGAVNLGGVTPYEMAVDSRGEHLVITTENNATLLLFRIPE